MPRAPRAGAPQRAAKRAPAPSLAARPVAKAIAARGIADDLFAVLNSRNGLEVQRCTPSVQQEIHQAFGEVIVRHLDAYDQRP